MLGLIPPPKPSPYSKRSGAMSKTRRSLATADRISSLPDSVLCHILSFLPTKEAVATSILSKKWNPLWLSVPTLDFILDFQFQSHEQPRETYSLFEKSVYDIMLSRDAHQPIKRLSFRLCAEFLRYFDTRAFTTWVNSALQRRVEHLEFLFSRVPGTSSCFKLPSGVLSCRTLVVLKLKSFRFEVVPSINLPSLKVLHLNNVYFSTRKFLTDLLSACPILEDLQALNLSFDYFSVSGKCKSLPKLVRADICVPSIPMGALNNVQFLHLHGDRGYMAKDIPVFYNLTHVELTYLVRLECQDVVEVLEHSPKLQSIIITKMLPYPLPEAGYWPYPKNVPKCISYHLKTCCLMDFIGAKGELQFASYIMQNARFLQTMKIQCPAKLDTQLKFEAIQKLSFCTRPSPTCRLSFE